MVVVCGAVWGQTNSLPTSGNVGIGINPASELLDIRGDNSKIKFSSTSPNVNSINILDMTVPYNSNSYERGSWITMGRETTSYGYRIGGQSSYTWANGISLQMQYYNNGWKDGLTLNYLGKIGIGTISPNEKLEVVGNIKVSGTANFLNGIVTRDINTHPDNITQSGYYRTNSAPLRYFTHIQHPSINYAIQIGNNYENDKLFFRAKAASFWGSTNEIWHSGNSNTSANDWNCRDLDVNGNIKAHEIEVTLASIDDMQLNGTLAANNITYTANGNTADFVFEDNYQLKDLTEVEAFIKSNKHLPEIPSAAEMEESGVNLAEMNKLLLMKVEELTLYSIEQEKKIEQRDEKVSGLELKVEEQNERLVRMEALLEELLNR